MKENFEALGLDETATKEDVEKAYKRLKTKYSRDRFLEGEAGNNAAKKLTIVENAYQELTEYFGEQITENETESASFFDVEEKIKNAEYDEAQRLLDSIHDRNAEWHYLQSVLFYKKNWINESKKQLEIALSLDPNNAKYNDSYEKLRKKVENNTSRFSNNGAYSGNNQGSNRQMGGTDMGDCCDCCAMWCCLNSLCGGCR
ncbi:MAG: hypothetical protein KBS91_04625 [Firmicutes bacterium]|nr:hypothetical protein [Candidatus Caballimonas caccae]